MKTIFLVLLAVWSCGSPTVNQENFSEEKTIYQFKVEDINGNTFDFADLKGKKVMIVNTASNCGLTPQIASLTC